MCTNSFDIYIHYKEENSVIKDVRREEYSFKQLKDEAHDLVLADEWKKFGEHKPRTDPDMVYVYYPYSYDGTNHFKKYILGENDFEMIMSTKQKYFVFRVDVLSALELMRNFDVMEKPMDPDSVLKVTSDDVNYFSDSEHTDSGYEEDFDYNDDEVSNSDDEGGASGEEYDSQKEYDGGESDQEPDTVLKTPEKAIHTSSSEESDFDPLFSYERQMGPRPPRPAWSPIRGFHEIMDDKKLSSEMKEFIDVGGNKIPVVDLEDSGEEACDKSAELTEVLEEESTEKLASEDGDASDGEVNKLRGSDAIVVFQQNHELLDNYQSDEGDIRSSDSEFEDVEYSWMEGPEFCIPKEPLEIPGFKIGMVFEDADEFRRALVEHSVRAGIRVNKVKNENSRVTAECAAVGCKWRIHASPVHTGKHTFMVKTHEPEHTCVRANVDRTAPVSWIADQFVPLLKENPKMSTEELTNVVAKFKIVVPYRSVYRAKGKALDIVAGGDTEAYSLLPRYCEMVKLSNPGSTVELEFVEEHPLPFAPHFKQFFLGLAAIGEGFARGCQPWITLDGCHLHGPKGGVLLSAIALDPNGGIYPLCFAVVAIEDTESWNFFFHCMGNFVGGWANKKWTFTTDRQKGLIEAIRASVPHATHRKCARHIYANMKRVHSGNFVKKWFWIACKAYNEGTFTWAMEKLKEKRPGAYRWLMDIPVGMWARHKFDCELKNDHVTSNVAESFNAWIGEFRGLSIYKAMEGIRGKLMDRMEKKRIEGERMRGITCPNTQKRLRENKENAYRLKLIASCEDEFQVLDGNRTFIVNLSEKLCDCGEWQLCGVPCNHGVKTIRYRREDVELYCDDSFSVANFKAAYAPSIRPVRDSDLWPPMDNVFPKFVQAPGVKKRIGRPKKHRRRECGEAARKYRHNRNRCSNCGDFGHNARGCMAQGFKEVRPRGTVQRRAWAARTMPEDRPIRELIGRDQPESSRRSSERPVRAPKRISSSQPVAVDQADKNKKKKRISSTQE